MDRESNGFPRQASPGRRWLQTIVALGGWAIFVYWWWLVFSRVSRAEVVFTGVFIAVTIAITLAVTLLWSLHNKRLHRRGDQRQRPCVVPENYSRDTLLRSVSFPAGPDDITDEPFVRIFVGENKKVYRSSRRLSRHA